MAGPKRNRGGQEAISIHNLYNNGIRLAAGPVQPIRAFRSYLLKTANFDLHIAQAGFFEKACIRGGDQALARQVACLSVTTEKALKDLDASTTFLLSSAF